MCSRISKYGRLHRNQLPGIGVLFAQTSAGVRFDDPALEIDWPEAITIVSGQDRNWPLLEDLMESKEES